MDVNDFINSFAKDHPEVPEIEDWCDTLLENYHDQCWHALADYLELFISFSFMQEGDALIRLYHNFIMHFATEIDPLMLSQFAVKVCQQYQQNKDGINFLESVIEKLKPMDVEEPILLLNMEKAFFFLKNRDKKECKNLLDDGKSVLDRMVNYNMDDCVYANYYRVLYEYHDYCDEYTDCYKSGLLYLAYESPKSLTDTSKRILARNLSICAFLGDNIYNFQDLLDHPVNQSLVGSTSECLYHILEAMNSGNIVQYKELCHVHKPFLDRFERLVNNEEKLLDKISITCLMEIIFRLPPEDRIIPLTVIAERTMRDVKDVERVLMKSLSIKNWNQIVMIMRWTNSYDGVHVIEGMIDPVAGSVNVTWVMPRALRVPDLEILRDRLDKWLGKTERAIASLNPNEDRAE